jgi:hypothetical protein
MFWLAAKMGILFNQKRRSVCYQPTIVVLVLILHERRNYNIQTY